MSNADATDSARIGMRDVAGGAAREDAAREDAARDGVARENAARADVAQEDVARQGAPRQGAAREFAVREVELPDGFVEFAGLDRVDYREAFAFDTAVRRTPEAWERLILAGAPLSDRITMVTCWTALGIRLALPGTSGQVLGWRILHSDTESIVLGVRAAVGMTARIVLRPSSGTVVHAMLIRCDNRLSAKIWHALAPKHRKFVAALLTRASGHTG